MADDDKTAKAPGAHGEIGRREFLGYSGSALGALSFGALTLPQTALASATPTYPIDQTVVTTRERTVAFPATLPGLTKTQIDQVDQYAKFGYGAWTYGAPLPVATRGDLLPPGAAPSTADKKTKLLRFFTFTDVHITDKEAPNQLISFQQTEPSAANVTSIYSPVMLSTTQVLDAAIQTVNALHKSDPFDFGVMLGDASNNPTHIELRWYIDVFDGKRITPSSGAHAGADKVDYQKPFKAAGLDRSIPWYQVVGNHDHFYLGSFPLDGDASLRASYTAGAVWAIGDPLAPRIADFPVLFDVAAFKAKPAFYPGVIDGASPTGAIVKAGAAADPAFAAGAPKVVADPARRALSKPGWIGEFYDTTTRPVGHGFHLARKSRFGRRDPGFACYSFTPKSHLPLKMIVLDDTQASDDGSRDIHGHGCLDAARWSWLKEELDAGQANHQLMIVAAHVPIAVGPIGCEMEWWGETKGIAPEKRNAVALGELIDKLRATPNLLMWIAGHRHVNTVKAFASDDPSRPERGFWQVETSSLRDFPQQFRTFDLYLNDDDTVSIVTLNVDPAVAEGSPAAKSRRYAIAVQQIVQNDARPNARNLSALAGHPMPTMDPSRPQNDQPDPTIQFADLGAATPPVPYNASYNAELLKPLTREMAAELRRRLA
ncbi:MAG: TIGR03768 family metallophosphoesterase [Roseiarcus sp.]|uniref:TIGR03768 family metallophosphoesterase n=1 Tax=Roseiarcus sp. TaxID=1969460 RepID=UPI003C133EDC